MAYGKTCLNCLAILRVDLAVDDRGQAFVDLTDVGEFERFILERSQP